MSKDLFWTERISNVFKDWRQFTKQERTQYRVDTKALLCRGLEPVEHSRVQNGLYIEQGWYFASRLYVPAALFGLYRKGIFEEAISFVEIKHIARIAICMHLIDLAGHAMFRYYTQPVVDKHIGVNEGQFANKKKQTMDDYLVQKNYFKTKKDNKL